MHCVVFIIPVLDSTLQLYRCGIWGRPHLDSLFGSIVSLLKTSFHSGIRCRGPRLWRIKSQTRADKVYHKPMMDRMKVATLNMASYYYYYLII